MHSDREESVWVRGETSSKGEQVGFLLSLKFVKQQAITNPGRVGGIRQLECHIVPVI